MLQMNHIAEIPQLPYNKFTCLSHTHIHTERERDKEREREGEGKWIRQAAAPFDHCPFFLWSVISSTFLTSSLTHSPHILSSLLHLWLPLSLSLSFYLPLSSQPFKFSTVPASLDPTVLISLSASVTFPQSHFQTVAAAGELNINLM